jgi:Protein tyrosine and serine/threonine kinase
VDVYSFGILLWEICSLEQPFHGYCGKKHMKEVVLSGERPKMDYGHVGHWPVELQWIMKSSWNSEPDARPSFDIIVDTLTNILVELKGPKCDRIRARSEGSPSSLIKGRGVTVDDFSSTRQAAHKGASLLKSPRIVSRPS